MVEKEGEEATLLISQIAGHEGLRSTKGEEKIRRKKKMVSTSPSGRFIPSPQHSLSSAPCDGGSVSAE